MVKRATPSWAAEEGKHDGQQLGRKRHLRKLNLDQKGPLDVREALNSPRFCCSHRLREPGRVRGW